MWEIFSLGKYEHGHSSPDRCLDLTLLTSHSASLTSNGLLSTQIISGLDERE